MRVEHIGFQSTRPRGARPSAKAELKRLAKCFNPRARGGRDADLPPCARQLLRFNPRARGGRVKKPDYQIEIDRKVSIHAPAGGATLR